MLHRKGIIRSRTFIKKMDNSLTTRSRNKFWFVFFFLFVSWYLLLYGIDWSSLPGFVTTSRYEANSIESARQTFIPPPPHREDDNVSFDSNSSSTIDDATNIDDTKDEPRSKEDESSSNDNDNVVVPDLEELEKELEPLLRKDEPQKEEVKKVEKIEREGDTKEEKSCTGRYIYVAKIPSKFNEDILKQCKLLNKWYDMCQYLVNMGLGPDLGNPQRAFSNKGWFTTNQFSLEVLFHNRMKQYECLTNDSSEASAVFVPYYSGFDIARYLWDDLNTTKRDAGSVEVTKFLKEKPEWKTMWGRDHFMIAGRITWDFRRGVEEDASWGSKLMWLPETKNMTILTIESSPWHMNDFAIPYPTYFHPSSDNDVVQWQNRMRRLRRRMLFSFAGAPRPQIDESIRGEIMEQCSASRRKCRLLECKDTNNKCNKAVPVMRLFQSSVFCLQPSGDSFTRRSTFDSILAGCIPVFFTPASAYVQYIWHLPKNYTSYSVLIPEDDVKEKKVSIENVLSKIPRQQVAAMREEVIKLIPNVVYADPRSRLETVEDAFDLAVKGVLERVDVMRKEMRQGKNSSMVFDEEYSWKYFTFGTIEKHEWDHFFLRTSKWKN
ncbi:Xyloglucan galactosyltransferase KATAMARI1 -like protein [Capsicum annuum]|uniref:Xyloglucan galactosyltransferase KATAMARI1 -like protein n=1 Tax=Capsicum annuum TaxID=4072 RepID=A0A1U8G3K1_CAPAN|nr:probable xyloglucan galactosyltransferase GT11 [Capsicum annuum]PHT88302.1 Xyloglucan galactosyltransferase KATAMARI1 -like protein [Capsicum annuum]